VPGRGRLAGYLVAGEPVRLGQVQQVAAAGGVGTQYYVTLADGLAPVHDAAALLLVSDPGYAAAYVGRAQQPIPRAAADVTAAPQSLVKVMPDGFPESVPQLDQPAAGDDGNAVACGAYSDTQGRSMTSSVHVGSTATPPADPGAPGRALVPPGQAAVVRLVAHSRVPTDALFLVTDAGIKYPVPTPDVLKVLGLGGVDPVQLPVGIVDAIPTGPALDPARANTAVPMPTPVAAGLPPDAGPGGTGEAGTGVPTDPTSEPRASATATATPTAKRRPPTARSRPPAATPTRSGG